MILRTSSHSVPVSAVFCESCPMSSVEPGPDWALRPSKVNQGEAGGLSVSGAGPVGCLGGLEATLQLL